MFKFLAFALFQSAVAILASHAMAGCREDPREARLGQEAAKLKAYNCDTGNGASAGGVKIEFYRFSNEVAATLVSGRPMESMTKIIGKPEFVKNSVFNRFKYILDRFGTVQNFGKDDEFRPNTEVNDTSFYGSDVGSITIFSVNKNGDMHYPAIEIFDLNKQEIPNNINVYYTCQNCDDPGDRRAVFWRYAKLEDLQEYHKNAILLSEAARSNKGLRAEAELLADSRVNYDSFGLLRYLAGAAGLPREFLILSGVYSQGCGQNAPSYWEFHLTTPAITLDAAVIRNDKPRPLRVDSVLAEEIADGSLRAGDDAPPANAQPMSLDVAIPPGHSLVIPTRMTLKRVESDFYTIPPKGPDGSAETYRRLRAKGISTRPNVFAVPELKEFVFGPELKVAGLVIDGNAINFAEKSQNFMDIAYSGQQGSCPYLMSWDNERRDWTEHGKVLHEASDRSREATQRIVLPGFVSRFRLEEREPEVATIDNAEIMLSLKNGNSMILKPDTDGSADAGRRFLFWGDAREFEFRLPTSVSPADVVQSSLSLTGYYERYSSLPNYVYQGYGASEASFSTVVNPPDVLAVGPICRASAATALNLSTAVLSPAHFARRQ